MVYLSTLVPDYKKEQLKRINRLTWDDNTPHAVLEKEFIVFLGRLHGHGWRLVLWLAKDTFIFFLKFSWLRLTGFWKAADEFEEAINKLDDINNKS